MLDLLNSDDALRRLQRHNNMAAIRGKDTKPELLVRKYLWAHGFRYRLNHPRLPGKPDMVLRKYRTCVFVNGCFWHGHGIASLDVENEKQETEIRVEDVVSSACCKIPKSNTGFWVRKIHRNKERDYEVQQKLAAMGWHSITIWECQLKPTARAQTLASLAFTLNHIYLEHHKVKRYELPEEPMAMVAEENPC